MRYSFQQVAWKEREFMSRLTAVLRFAGGLALLAAGCGGKAGNGVPDDPWIVGVLLPDLSDTRLAQQKQDLEMAAALEPGIKLIVRDAAGDADTQLAQVREFLEQGVALLVINPTDPSALSSAAAEAMAKRVPVVALDRKIEGGKYTCFIGSDNVKLGEIAGRRTAELVGRGGKVIELKGHRVAEFAQERHEGFLAGLQGWDVQVILDVDCRGTEEDARRETTTALGLHSRVDAVFAHTDAMARGAYLAVKDEGRGREQRIQFIGIGGQPKVGMQYVREGILAMCIENPTGGAKVVMSVLRILRHDYVLKNIILGTCVFTGGNVEKGGEPIE